MAFKSQDSKLIENYVAGKTMRDVRDFVPLYDENNQVMMLYLHANTGVVSLVYQNSVTGQASEHLELSVVDQEPPEGPTHVFHGSVEAFSAVQNAISNEIYVLIAGKIPDVFADISIPLFASPQLSILGPVDPAHLKSPKYLKSAPIKRMQIGLYDASFTITAAHLGKPSKEMPCMVVRTRIQDSASDMTWMYVPNREMFMELDTQDDYKEDVLNPQKSKILDMACGTIGSEHGMWILRRRTWQHGPPVPSPVALWAPSALELSFYQISDSGTRQQRRFNIPRDPQLALTTEDCRIATLQNDYGGQDLLVVNGYSLIHFAAADLFSNPKTVSTHVSMHQSAFLHITQQGDEVRLWSECTKGGSFLGYSKFGLSRLQHSTTELGISLVPFSDNGCYSETVKALCMPSNTAYDQHFLRLNADGAVDVINQSHKTGLWTKQQAFFTFPEVSELVKMQTYTTRVNFNPDPKSKSLRDIEIAVAQTWAAPFGTPQPPSSTMLWVNGVKYSIAPNAPLKLTLPSFVSLEIMQETSNLGARQLTITDVNSGSKLDVDPVKEAMGKIRSLDSPQALRNAGAEGTDEELQSAVDHLKSLVARGSTLSQYKPGIHALGFGEWLEEGWHWIEHKGKEAINEIKKLGEAAWVINVAGKALELAINTWHAIGMAVNTILKGIKWAWNKVVSFLGDVFDTTTIMARTEEINQSLTKVVDYGRSIFDASIDDIKLFVQMYVKSIEGKVDGILDRFAQLDNPGIDEMNKGEGAGSSLIKSAKMSVILTALDKGAGVEVKFPSMPQVGDPMIDDALKKAENAVAGNPDLAKKLQTVMQTAANAMVLPIKIHDIVAVIKPLFHFAIEAAEKALDMLLDLIKILIDKLFNVLVNPIEVPVITPLLRLWAGTNSGYDLPSPIKIVSFVLAVASVELEVFGLLDPPKPRSYDVVAGLPNSGVVQNQMQSWFKSHNPSEIHAMNTMAIATTDSSNDASDDNSATTESQASKNLTHVSAIGHPIVIAGHWVLSNFKTISFGFRVMMHQTVGRLPVKPGTAIIICDVIEFVLNLADIAFTIPPRIERPQRGAMIAASVLSASNGLLTFVGAMIPGKSQNLQCLFASASFLLSMGSMSASSVAQHVQLSPEATKENKNGWEDYRQQDLTILKLRTGNITCAAVTALAGTVGEAGMIVLESEKVTLQTLAVGILLVGVGSTFMNLAAIPDLVIDSIKSNRENAKEETERGGYVGGATRR